MDMHYILGLGKYSKVSLILISFIQARKIAPVFQLKPETVYLINEFDNVAVFLSETSGRFNHSSINTSAV